MISNTSWILNVCDVLIKKDVPQDILEYMVRVIWGEHLLSRYDNGRNGYLSEEEIRRYRGIVEPGGSLV